MRLVTQQTEAHDAAELIAELKAGGFRVIVDPPELLITPASELSPDLRRRIVRHGAAIVQYILRENRQ